MGMNSFPQQNNQEAEVSPPHTEASKETPKMTRDQMESVVSSIDPANSPESWRTVKKELDASGWNYREQSVQYDRLVDGLIAKAASRGDYASVKEILDIFGADTLSKSRREKIAEQARGGIGGSVLRGKVDKDWLKNSVEGLKLVGVTDNEIGDLVYEKMTVNGMHYSDMPAYFPLVPGLADKVLRKR